MYELINIRLNNIWSLAITCMHIYSANESSLLASRVTCTSIQPMRVLCLRHVSRAHTSSGIVIDAVSLSHVSALHFNAV